MKLKKEDIKSNIDVNIDIENSVPYKYFFEKKGKNVYRYSKIGNGDWQKDLMPFDEIPFIEYKYYGKNRPRKQTILS